MAEPAKTVEITLQFEATGLIKDELRQLTLITEAYSEEKHEKIAFADKGISYTSCGTYHLPIDRFLKKHVLMLIDSLAPYQGCIRLDFHGSSDTHKMEASYDYMRMHFDQTIDYLRKAECNFSLRIGDGRIKLANREVSGDCVLVNGEPATETQLQGLNLRWAEVLGGSWQLTEFETRRWVYVGDTLLTPNYGKKLLDIADTAVSIQGDSAALKVLHDHDLSREGMVLKGWKRPTSD